MANYENRREVLLAYLARIPVSEIAKDLGVSKVRVYQIIRGEQDKEMLRAAYPNDARVYLSMRYDETYPKMAAGVVNAMRRSKYMLGDPDTTIEHLFRVVGALSDDDLLSIRNMGIRKVLFLRMAVREYDREVKANDRWCGSKAKDDRKKKVFKLVHISGIQRVWRKRSRDRHRGVGRRNASDSRAKTSAVL